MHTLPDLGSFVRTIVDTDAEVFTCSGCTAPRRDALGRYIGFVPEANGDVWKIEHKDKSIGAYLFSEVFDI